MTRNIYIIPNPDGTDPAVYTNILVYRAPDNAGAPGIFVQITTPSILIDTSNEETDYLDTGGALTSWYQHQYQTADTLTTSDLSPAMQLGDYLVRQWIKKDITDADLSDNVLWNNWRDQTFIDMQAIGLGRQAASQDFAPATTTDYSVALRADIRRISRVEIWFTTGLIYWTWIKSWEQRGRTFRLFFPKTGYTYRLYGLAEIRSLYDLDDELFMVLYFGMRWRYMLFRSLERVDIRPQLSRTRQSDTTSQMDYKRLADDAKILFDQAIDRSLLNEGMPDGGIA